MSQFAEVVLPLAVDKSFTYLIPPELQHSAVSGVRAIVPFGRKYATGLIVDLPATSHITGLKPLRDIIDASPVVSPELLALCRWIAEYYFAPLGEVLKSAMPHGFAASRRLALPSLLGSDLDREIDRLKSQAPKRAQVLRLLAQHGPMLVAELQRKVGLKTINAALNEMEHAAQLRTAEIIPRTQQKAKTRKVVALDSTDSQRVAAALGLLSSRKKKAQQLLRIILQLKDQGRKDISVTDLLKMSGATSSSLKEFVSSGILTVTSTEIARVQDYGTEEQTLHIVLNQSQRDILQILTDAIDAGTARHFLLLGVTGSGKTQVYIEAMRHCLACGKTAIVLVPEISLTPQIVRRFKSHFGDRVAVVHSRMSAGERHDVWRLALRGTYRVVIGPRSAVFAPLANLGLIVVDEEHEASYKQYDATPRYHARDVAVVRGQHSNAVVLLGSATPSAESYHNALSGKYTLLEMQERIDQVPMPTIRIVDMIEERKRAYAAMKESLPPDQRSRLREFRQSSISDLLKREIELRLERKEGVILLQNRRGFAPFVECPECGYTETCDNCSITLTYHLAKKHLRCHYCGLVRIPHTQCPDCKGSNIQLLGIGTQKVEEELAALFPGARVLRMDLDTTTRKGAHDRILKKFGEGEADILLGTQMVAKGLDFPRVTLVGVVSADTQMLLPDFRSSERTFQLLTQVAGRAGRSTLQGEVVIQTHQPHHYTLQHIVDHDIRKFFDEELEERRELDYPPFARLALIEAKGEKEAEVQLHAEKFAALLKKSDEAFTILGPSAAVIAKIKNQYRWHVIVKSPKATDPSGSRLRTALRRALVSYEQTASGRVKLTIDSDPVGLM